MTDYIIELYEKGERKPYRRFKITLPSRYKPTYVEFDPTLKDMLADVYKARLYYASNSKAVACTYIDKEGHKRIRWDY